MLALGCGRERSASTPGTAGDPRIPADVPGLEPQPAFCAPDVEGPHVDTTGDSPEADDDGGTEDSGTPGFTISADVDLIAVPQGGSIPVVVHVTRASGFDESIAVTLDGLPSGVSTTDPVLGPDATTGAIVVSAPLTVGVPNPDLARIRGHASAGTRSAPVAVTVRGKPGSLDHSFGYVGAPALLEAAQEVVELSDGKLLVTGREMDEFKLTLCRLEPDGTPDSTFGSNGGCVVADTASTGLRIAVTESAIFIAATHPEGLFLVRFTPDGVVDSTSVIAVGALVHPQELLAVGDKLIVAGGRYPSDARVLMRLTTNGVLDESFSDDGLVELTHPASDVVRRANGTLVVASGTTLQSYCSDGSVDASFGIGGSVALTFGPSALAIREDGGLVAGGHRWAFGHVSAAGGIENTYPATIAFPVSEEDDPRYGAAGDLAVMENGAILFGATICDSSCYIGLGRRLADGSPDPHFGTSGAKIYGGEGGGNDVKVLRDGRYLIAGGHYGGYARLVRVWNQASPR